MKKTLFLALLSVPLVLSACAKKKAAAATRTTVATASQAAVEAPASVAGKTVIISLQGAVVRSRETYEDNEPWSAWTASSGTIPPIVFKNSNYLKEGSDLSGNLLTANYTKISATKAKLEYYNRKLAVDGSPVFILTFKTPNSGTATWTDAYGDNQEEGKNATFIIK